MGGDESWKASADDEISGVLGVHVWLRELS